MRMRRGIGCWRNTERTRSRSEIGYIFLANAGGFHYNGNVCGGIVSSCNMLLEDVTKQEDTEARMRTG